MQEFAHTIDGRPVTSQASFDVVNPATGLPFARCPDASRDQLDAAVAAARRAFPGWSARTFTDRRDVLLRLAALMHEAVDPLAALLVREQGKTLAECRRELSFVPRQIERIASIAVEGDVLRDDPTGRIELRYRPLGVAGIITPWNVPVGIAIGRITQALYTGNTVVQKPSPYTPLATVRMGGLVQQVLPPGVLNVLAGGNDLGAWMTTHPGIDKLSFTGSVATGKQVLAGAAGTLKRVTLELGGNDPAIVLDDADPAVVAPRIFRAAFANSGQICVAIKRLYVPESLYEAMGEALAALARDIRVGDGLDPASQMGPVQNRAQFDKVLAIIDDARTSGARILCGGHALDRPGYFIAPTIVTDIEDGTRLVEEEPFGPVLPVLRYRDVDEAIRRANATRYGLSGSVWTRDLDRGAAIAARLEVGTAFVNEHRIPDATVPFGGAKESGLGREYSALGLKSYMEPQVVHVAPLV
jgi:acyl-CoA reductase-like NAD-dependent aldehyde dehydrogenase